MEAITYVLTLSVFVLRKLFLHLTGFDGVQQTLGKTQQQGIEQGCHYSMSLTQDR